MVEKLMILNLEKGKQIGYLSKCVHNMHLHGALSSFIMTEPATAKGDHKCLLLQTGYHPDHSNATSPPSPLPCYHNELHDDDVLSISSKDSYHSNQLKLQYEFLKYDDQDNHQLSSLAKRRSEDFSKKIAMSRRRKDQLEEMLGEVDTQLN